MIPREKSLTYERKLTSLEKTSNQIFPCKKKIAAKRLSTFIEIVFEIRDVFNSNRKMVTNWFYVIREWKLRHFENWSSTMGTLSNDLLEKKKRSDDEYSIKAKRWKRNDWRGIFIKYVWSRIISKCKDLWEKIFSLSFCSLLWVLCSLCRLIEPPFVEKRFNERPWLFFGFTLNYYFPQRQSGIIKTCYKYYKFQWPFHSQIWPGIMENTLSSITVGIALGYNFIFPTTIKFIVK